MLSNLVRQSQLRPQNRQSFQRAAAYHHVRSVLRPSKAAKTAESYAAAIQEAEAKKDWLSAFEALTEARVTSTQLPAPAIESAIRTLADGGQWQRSADLMDNLIGSGSMPHRDTVKAVFTALTAGQQADRAAALLQSLQSLGTGPEHLVTAHNSVIRCYARCGRAIAAYDLLDKLMSSKSGIIIEMETFAAVSLELMKSCEAEKAEEVLEWRDYLNGD